MQMKLEWSNYVIKQGIEDRHKLAANRRKFYSVTDNYRMATPQFTLSDESKERLVKTLEYSKTIAHYGFIPFVLYLGWSASPNKPSLINLLSPFPTV
ncbi:translocase of the outer mitochondrial membrane [Meyerozyma guilliermondii]